MAVAQQHNAETIIEATPHETPVQAGGTRHFEAGAVEAIPHSSTPHQGVNLIAQQEEPRPIWAYGWTRNRCRNCWSSTCGWNRKRGFVFRMS